ncbi:MAG: hypothetical protein AMXMBFR64_08000 [Myxococcales bacterium]
MVALLPDSSRIRTRLAAQSLDDVLAAAATVIAPTDPARAAAVLGALRSSTAAHGLGLGEGVAAPHAEVAGLDQAVCALIVTTRPLDVGAPDAEPADLFFVVVAPPDDPGGHLHALARVARLATRPLLRRGLRQAATAEEAQALIDAAEAREGRGTAPQLAAAGDALAVLTVVGERMTDRLMVTLVEAGFGDATVLEAQSAEEAVTQEVPLFSSLRDLFADPGGRRVVLLEVSRDRVAALKAAVLSLRSPDARESARMSLIPLLEVVTAPASDLS